MSETAKISVGKGALSLDVSPEFDAYSGVEIIVNENTTYFAGNKTGRVLTINNPWGTQEQANNIIAEINKKGFQYKPFKSKSVLLNPAAEIGDGITISDTYSGIYKMSRDYSPMMNADLEAPQDEEIDHEYPYKKTENREIERRFSAVESEFAIQSNEISAKVSETGGSNSSVSWSLNSNAWTVKANGTEVFRINKSGATVTGVIRATSGQIGGFNIGASAIYSGMPSLSSKSNGVYVGTDGIACGGGKFIVTSSGEVTASRLAITGGTIDIGNNFSVDSNGNVSANNMTLSGTLTVGGSKIGASVLRSGASTAYNRAGAWNGTTTTVNDNGSYWTGGADGGYQAKKAFNNNTEVTYLKTKYLTATQGWFKVGDYTAKWKSETLVKSINVSRSYNSTLGQYVVSNVTNTQSTIFYLGR